LRPTGFPHSEILGSQLVCSSPRLIAAYHVLRRLPVPRHPPCALTRLISVSRCDSSTPQHTHSSVVKERKRKRRSSVESAGDDSGAFRSSPLRAGLTRRSRKEVIQPQVPLRLPCYDFAPVTELTLDGCPLAVGPPVSGPSSFHGVTGGVYKARERIHRGVADPRLLAIPASCSRVADCNPNLARLLAIGSPSRVRDALYQAL
jgi:hypothetical protein